MCCSILKEMTLDLREMHLTIFWKKDLKCSAVSGHPPTIWMFSPIMSMRHAEVWMATTSTITRTATNSFLIFQRFWNLPVLPGENE